VTLQTYGGSKAQYCTPPALLEPVYRLFGDVIDLDPCSHPNSIVRSRMQILLPEYEHELMVQCNGFEPEAHTFFGDGLSEEAEFMWRKAQTTFVNPPFNAVPAWLAQVKKASYHGNEIIVLTNADVSTKWFHLTVFRDADGVCFRQGRTKFLGAKHTNPWPHMYSYFGHRGDEFNDVFSDYGTCL
jgi:hypothetical protein